MLLTCPVRARTVAFSLLLMTATGCVATSMTAERTRVPILLGPVACIGCPGGAAPAVPYATPILDTASRLGGTALFGSMEIAGNEMPHVDAKVDAVVPDPCAGEVYISRLKASSFSVFAFFVVTSQEKVELEAAATPLARGMCGAPAGPPGGAP